MVEKGVDFITKTTKECLEIMEKAGVTGVDPQKTECMFCPAMEGCQRMWGPNIDDYDKKNLQAAFKSKDMKRIKAAMVTYTKRQNGVIEPYKPEVI